METTASLAVSLGTAIIDNAPYLAGFILPPVIKLLGRKLTTSTERLIFSLLISFFVAVILHWHEIAFGSPEIAIIQFGLIFTESHAVYKLYFQQSWFNGLDIYDGGEKTEEETPQEPILQ